jgi:hypothetical protein
MWNVFNIIEVETRENACKNTYVNKKNSNKLSVV